MRYIIDRDHLYVHFGIHLTKSYPIKTAFDGGHFVVFPDQEEAELVTEVLGIDEPDLQCWQGWEPRVLDVRDLPKASFA